MQVLYPCCCGLDIHKKFVVACVLTTTAEGGVTKASRTFSTMTPDLLALADWLRAVGCTHVAMESTSAYWRPVYNLLEGQFDLLVVNAYHMKAVPGRKTDVKDAEWIADLLRHGLLRPSFIPAPAQRHLRDLTRYRTHLVEERARLTNRLQADVTRIASLVHADPAIGSLNLSGYQSERADELAAAITTEINPERSAELNRELQTVIAEELPFIMLLYPDGAYAYNSGVYAGWAFMTGQGVFHKLSFLPEAARP